MSDRLSDILHSIVVLNRGRLICRLLREEDLVTDNFSHVMRLADALLASLGATAF